MIRRSRWQKLFDTIKGEIIDNKTHGVIKRLVVRPLEE